MAAIVLDEALSDEDLLLDLLNTTPALEGVRRDELDEHAASRAWQQAHGGTGTSKELARIRQVRTTLQRLVQGEESPAALAPFIGSVSYRPTATDNGLKWALDVAPDDRLAARALLAWDELRVTAPGRLRPCANDECELYLIDRSKANTARWCSMATCGNRMKARRHYQRQRETQQ